MGNRDVAGLAKLSVMGCGGPSLRRL